ncbi:uncharacterized protein DS421_1g31480 [Arachis hypogaea]|nr:uncharacterized protein DS421_1g31480 [Arachis hypogaea]
MEKYLKPKGYQPKIKTYKSLPFFSHINLSTSNNHTHPLLSHQCGRSADSKIQKTLMELLNQLDGFDQLEKQFRRIKNFILKTTV